MTKLRENELRRVLARARQSAFYRDRLPKTLSPSQMPVTTKADLRAAYPFGMLAVPKHKIATYHESSGTEGKPIASCFTEGDWDDIASRFARNAIQIGAGDLMFIKTPYSMVTTAHQAHFAARRSGAAVVPADNRSSNMPYSRVVRLLKDLEVTVTWSLPTEILLWKLALAANFFGESVKLPSLRAFWVAGEPLSLGKRKALQALWGGVPLFEDYGSTETGSLAGECRAGRLHLWEDRLHFELRDAQGKIVESGRGELLVTPLLREAMPLLRYHIEDEVEVASEPCPCGGEGRTLRVLGRSKARFAVGSKELFPLEVEDAVYRAGSEFGLTLWRGRATCRALELEFAAQTLEFLELDRFEAEVSQRLGVPVRARLRGTSAFIPERLLTDEVRFSKPRFLFQAGERVSRGVQYA